MKEVSISTRIAQYSRSPHIQDELVRRVDRILNPQVGYKSLALNGLLLDGSAQKPKRKKGAVREVNVALQQIQEMLHIGRIQDWINRKSIALDSPFDIRNLPNQELIHVDKSFSRNKPLVLTHTLLHRKNFLKHGDGHTNNDFLRFIVHTAVKLAQKEKLTGEKLTQTEVLHAFAVSVVLAQIHATQGKIREVIHLKPEDMWNDPVVVGDLETAHLVVHKDKERNLKRAIRDQIAFYAIGIYTLYGFGDVMTSLLHEKASNQKRAQNK